MSETVIVVPSATPVLPPTEPTPDPSTAALAYVAGQNASELDALASEVTDLKAEIEAVAAATNDAQATAETALDISIDAVTETVNAEPEPIIIAEPEPEPEIEPDNPPGKTHWLKRSLNEWLGRS